MRKWGIAMMAALLAGASCTTGAAEVSLDDLVQYLGVHAWTTSYTVPAGAKEVRITVEEFERNKVGAFQPARTELEIEIKRGENSFPLLNRYELRVLDGPDRRTLLADDSCMSLVKPEKLRHGISQWFPLASSIGDGAHPLSMLADGPGKLDMSVTSDGIIKASDAVKGCVVLTIRSSK